MRKAQRGGMANISIRDGGSHKVNWDALEAEEMNGEARATKQSERLSTP